MRKKILIAIVVAATTSNAAAKDALVEQVVSTYKANEARFHAQFRGKELRSKGLVTSITTDPIGVGLKFYITSVPTLIEQIQLIT